MYVSEALYRVALEHPEPNAPWVTCATYWSLAIQPAEGSKAEGLGDEIGPLMMIAGGISPDVLSVNFRRIDSYVRQGILYPSD